MYKPEEVYYAAEKLFPYLDTKTQEELSPLLEHAKKGEKVSYSIVKILSEQDEFIRSWALIVLFGETKEIERLAKSYQPIAGDIGSVEAGSIWVCPETACDFEWRVYRAGRPVPPCPEHKVALVPVN